jgi:hypothetical protein
MSAASGAAPPPTGPVEADAVRDPAPRFALPAEVAEVFDLFRTCELATIGRDGTPATWPAFPLYRPDRGTFLFTTSVGLPQKVYNIRRDPHVSLLFSDPTGTSLPAPPVVLVQGVATCPDELVTEASADLEELARRAFERQPFARHYGRDPISRRLFGWYYVRLGIDVVPHRIRWWPDGDRTRPPREVPRVA